MTDNKAIRIDKFLWAVRIFKTRSIASEECKKGRIIINDIQVKPSRIVARGEIIIVKKLPVIYTYRILEPIENRVSAKIVGNYIEDLTPEEEKAKLKLKQSGVNCSQGKRHRPADQKRKAGSRQVHC